MVLGQIKGAWPILLLGAVYSPVGDCEASWEGPSVPLQAGGSVGGPGLSGQLHVPVWCGDAYSTSRNNVLSHRRGQANLRGCYVRCVRGIIFKREKTVE